MIDATINVPDGLEDLVLVTASALPDTADQFRQLVAAVGDRRRVAGWFAESIVAILPNGVRLTIHVPPDGATLDGEIHPLVREALAYDARTTAA